MHRIELDPALLQRYGTHGPRYTSYPTAMEFQEDFGDTHYAGVALASNDDPIPRPLSLYVHIPFCSTLCYYCACTKIVTRHPRKAEIYLEYLKREIALQSRLFDRDRPVRQLHLGGGTPTFLTSAAMKELMMSLEENFPLTEDEAREFSIEVDPRTVSEESIQNLAGLGFNRLSMGIQDLDPDVQRAVNRIQSPSDTFAVFDSARRCGFRSISVDLIYGLPHQTVPGFALTLYKIIAHRPDRIALYSYAHLPGRFKAQRKLDAYDLPTSEEKIAIFERAVSLLTEAGYVYIGMDHFVRPDNELVRARRAGELQRNFQGYSTHAGADLIGLGMSAISMIGDYYSQNLKDLSGYYAALDQERLPVWRGLELTPDDCLRREIIQSLMCYGRLDCEDIEDRYGIDFREYFADALSRLEHLQADQLIEVGDGHLVVTPRGRLLLRVIAMVFDAYRGKPGEQAFSHVV